MNNIIDSLQENLTVAKATIREILKASKAKDAKLKSVTINGEKYQIIADRADEFKKAMKDKDYYTDAIALLGKVSGPVVTADKPVETVTEEPEEVVSEKVTPSSGVEEAVAKEPVLKEDSTDPIAVGVNDDYDDMKEFVDAIHDAVVVGPKKTAEEPVHRDAPKKEDIFDDTASFVDALRSSTVVGPKKAVKVPVHKVDAKKEDVLDDTSSFVDALRSSTVVGPKKPVKVPVHKVDAKKEDVLDDTSSFVDALRSSTVVGPKKLEVDNSDVELDVLSPKQIAVLTNLVYCFRTQVSHDPSDEELEILHRLNSIPEERLGTIVLNDSLKTKFNKMLLIRLVNYCVGMDSVLNVDLDKTTKKDKVTFVDAIEHPEKIDPKLAEDERSPLGSLARATTAEKIVQEASLVSTPDDGLTHFGVLDDIFGSGFTSDKKSETRTDSEDHWLEAMKALYGDEEPLDLSEEEPEETFVSTDAADDILDLDDDEDEVERSDTYEEPEDILDLTEDEDKKDETDTLARAERLKKLLETDDKKKEPKKENKGKKVKSVKKPKNKMPKDARKFTVLKGLTFLQMNKHSKCYNEALMEISTLKHSYKRYDAETAKEALKDLRRALPTEIGKDVSIEEYKSLQNKYARLYSKISKFHGFKREFIETEAAGRKRGF